MADKKQRTMTIRYSMEDQDKLIKAYESMGAAGEKFVRQIKKSNEDASSSMKALDTAVDAGKEKFKEFGNQLPVAARVLGNFGPAGVAAATGVALAAAAVREFAKYQEPLIRFEATLRAGGLATRELVENIKNYAEQIERTTLFSAEQALDAGAKLATFKNISKDSFEEVLSLSADLAAVFGGDLSSASLTLGKALEDPIRGITLLRRQGVLLGDQQQQQVKDFVAAGESAKAQAVILDALKNRVGGVAIALGGTLAGSWQHLGSAVSDAMKAIGEGINDLNGGRSIVQATADDINRAVAQLTGRLGEYKEQQRRIREEAEKAAEAQAKAREEQEKQKAYEDKVAALNAGGGNFVGISLPGSVEVALAVTEQLAEEHRLLNMTKEDREVELELRKLINQSAEEGHAIAANDPQIEILREKIRLNQQLRDVQQGAIKEYIDSLEKERQMTALSSRARAIAQALDKGEIEAKKEKRSLTDEEREQIRDLTASTYDLQRTQKDQVGEYIKSLDQELQLLGLSNRERAVQEALINATNKAKQAERRITDEELRQVREKAGAIFDQKEASKQAADALKQDAEIFKQFARDGYNAVTNSFESAFNGTLNSAEDFFDQLKKIWARGLANLATISIAQPVIIPVIETIGSAAGLDRGALDAITKEFGGKSGGGSALSGIGNLSSISDLLGIKGTGSGIIDAINSFGASHLGFAQVSRDFVGPLLPGTTTGQTFGSFLGSTGIGASIGGFAASMLGLGSNNAWVNSGASLAGAALGNLLLPGIGGIIGSFGGTALAGLFGGGTPHPASNVGAGGFDTSGNLINAQFSSKHTDTQFAQAIAAQIGTLGQQLDALGLDLTTIKSVQAGNDNGRGFISLGDFKKWDSNTIQFDPNDQKAMDRALGEFAKMVTTRVGGLSGDLSVALEKIKTDGRSASEVMSDIAFVLKFDELGKAPETLTETEQKLKELTTLFDAAADTATRLGLSVEKVRIEQQKQIDTARADLLGAINQNILAAVDAQAAAAAAEQKRYEAAIKDLKLLGATQADLRAAELEHQINLASILKQNNRLQQQGLQAEQTRLAAANDAANRYGSLSGTLGNLLDSLKLGNYSDLSPGDKLDAIRKQLATDFAAANDNIAAKEDLARLLPDFLELSRTINGSNTVYAADRKFAADIATKTKSIADQQLETQKELAAKAQEQIDVIQNGFSALKQATLITQQVAALNANPPSADYKGGGFSASNLNETYIRNADALKKAGLLDTAEAVIKAYTYGLSGGGGRRSAFFATNPDIEAAARQTLRDMGIPGFRDGGLISGGIAGVDSVPILTMQGERVLSVNQSTMLETIYTASRRAVNDNSAVSEIRALRADVQRLTAVLHAHGITNIDGLRGVAKKVEDLASSPRLKPVVR